MKLSGCLTQLALLTPAIRPNRLPPCSTDSPTPCRCPRGFAYEESVTFSVTGAPTVYVRDLTSDFFNTEWWGGHPASTHGTDNVPGVSTRTAPTEPAEGATFTLEELLTMRKFGPGGSYIEKIELKDPIGPFGGYWITLDSQGVFQNVTYIVWSVYGCSKGHPQDYAAFYELAQQNITDVLTKQGKFVGPNVDPISIQSFGNYPGKNKCFGFHPDTGPVGTCVRKN